MIKIDNISFSYGSKPILNNFSLEIKRGERLYISGESGIGKTTLLRLIIGLEKPQTGKITYSDSLRFSAVFQEDRLLPFMSILDNCTLVGANTDTAKAHLAALGILSSADNKPHALSGGMKRRAAIARALSAEYDLLILDEPFTGLDAENIATAAAYISEQSADRALLIVTHSAAEAELLKAREIKI